MIFKVSLFLHVLAAIFWIGGMLFLSLVVAPFLKSLDDPAKKSEIYQVVGKRYRFLGWVAIVILLVTGPVNFYYIGVTPGMFFDVDFYGTPYGKTVALKLFFVGLIVVSSLVHDFWLGPKARGSAGYSRIAMIFGRGNLLLALIIVAFAVMLRAGGL